MIVLYLMMGKYLGMTVKGLNLCYTWWSTCGWLWKGSICVIPDEVLGGECESALSVLYLMQYLGMTVNGLYLCCTWWSTWGWLWKGSICVIPDEVLGDDCERALSASIFKSTENAFTFTTHITDITDMLENEPIGCLSTWHPGYHNTMCHL